MAQDDRYQVIRYYDRDMKRLETEAVYGGRWLRWTYGTVVGRLALWALVKDYISTGSSIFRINSTGTMQGVTREIWCIAQYDAGREQLTILRWREED